MSCYVAVWICYLINKQVFCAKRSTILIQRKCVLDKRVYSFTHKGDLTCEKLFFQCDKFVLVKVKVNFGSCESCISSANSQSWHSQWHEKSEGNRDAVLR